jgi:hypothetical protein
MFGRGADPAIQRRSRLTSLGDDCNQPNQQNHRKYGARHGIALSVT